MQSSESSLGPLGSPSMLEELRILKMMLVLLIETATHFYSNLPLVVIEEDFALVVLASMKDSV